MQGLKHRQDALNPAQGGQLTAEGMVILLR